MSTPDNRPPSVLQPPAPLPVPPVPAPGITLEQVAQVVAQVNAQNDAKWEQRFASLQKSLQSPPAPTAPVQPAAPKPESNPYQDALKQRVESDMAGLSEKDKKLVLELAGDDPLQQFNMLSKLQASGKITVNPSQETESPDNADPANPSGEDGQPAKPGETTVPTQPGKSRLDLSGTPPSGKRPSNFKEAAQMAQQRIRAGQR